MPTLNEPFRELRDEDQTYVWRKIRTKCITFFWDVFQSKNNQKYFFLSGLDRQQQSVFENVIPWLTSVFRNIFACTAWLFPFICIGLIFLLLHTVSSYKGLFRCKICQKFLLKILQNIYTPWMHMFLLEEKEEIH